jgi:hypothetical protein
MRVLFLDMDLAFFGQPGGPSSAGEEDHREWLSVRCATLNGDNRNESKKLNCARPGSSRQIFKAGNWLNWHSSRCLPPFKGSERKLAPMTVSSPNVIEIKLDRLIDDMRFLRSQMIAFDRQLKGIEQQPESKSRPWFVAAASATARTVLILFAVGAATGAALLYLGT